MCVCVCVDSVCGDYGRLKVLKLLFLFLFFFIVAFALVAICCYFKHLFIGFRLTDGTVG